MRWATRKYAAPNVTTAFADKREKKKTNKFDDWAQWIRSAWTFSCGRSSNRKLTVTHLRIDIRTLNEFSILLIRWGLIDLSGH